MSDTAAQRAFATEAGIVDQLYPIGDSVALAIVLDRLLSDPDRLAEARERAYRLGQDRFNWRQESVKLISVVARAIRIGTPTLERYENVRDMHNA
jgi:hypothetical protein